MAKRMRDTGEGNNRQVERGRVGWMGAEEVKQGHIGADLN